jgi:hypothetical protein
MGEPIRHRVHKINNPAILTSEEAEKVAHAAYLVSLQQERAGMDVRILNRAIKKIMQSKYRREIEIPAERLKILE